MAEYLICIGLIPALTSLSPNSRSSPPYCILSSKPLIANISFFHPLELWPFQLGVVGVTVLRNFALNPLDVSLLVLNPEVWSPCSFSQLISKQFCSRISFLEIAFDVSIGSLK